MIKRFEIKNKEKKIVYHGWCFIIFRLKFEVIFHGRKRMYRVEWNDWIEDCE